MTQEPRNIGVSVRARLLHLAKERGDEFQYVLTRYANERLLFRMAQSRHGSSFILKGAALFTVWTGEPHRATKDVDLLGFGTSSEERIRAIFEEVLNLEVDDDGVSFDTDSMEVGPIREDQDYGGLRVMLNARITSAKIRLQVDIGFGDAVTPEALDVVFPCLLDFEAPRLRAYPRETVVAEKLEAMVKLGLLNSRMKDFYDLVVLSRMFPFEGDVLVRAIDATFARRSTQLPTSTPIALSADFSSDKSKNMQWQAFQRKSGGAAIGSLGEVIIELSRFVHEPLRAAAASRPFHHQWNPGGPWE